MILAPLNPIEMVDICLKEQGFWTAWVGLLASESTDRKVVKVERYQVPRQVSQGLPMTHPVIGSNAVAIDSRYSNLVLKLVIRHQRFQSAGAWKMISFGMSVLTCDWGGGNIDLGRRQLCGWINPPTIGIVHRRSGGDAVMKMPVR